MNQEAVLLSRKGFYAGTMRYISAHEVAINDDAYIMVPKANWLGKVNLRWFVQQYASPIRACVTSRSDNATFNKRWLDKIPIRVPKKPIQDALAQKTIVLKEALEKLEQVDNELSSLLALPIRQRTFGTTSRLLEQRALMEQSPPGRRPRAAPSNCRACASQADL